ncbi:ABC transporter permease [Glycomyces harbinensis]|uniref:ABC-type transport system involved in multi-copper enzyme maturation, permease component n=1 Tax=Glycomyces harbinensis TaxID=58114 RepID=A0A1G6V136_9ACTN|nr:ABC transporter permease [Glycomyces harbinensis]SDD47211.1 ABC-type transport system involved in multi-copper enzyme maturation, permease component [Glycomyces harbinensis]
MSAFANAASAEWVKLRSVRSTAVTLSVFAALALGFGWLIGGSVEDAFYNGDTLSATFMGLLVAQLVLVTFAVSSVGSEYSTGTIKAALAAVPSRGRLFAAKMAAVGAAVAAAVLPVELAAFAIVQSRAGAGAVPWTAWETVESLLGGWISMTLLCVFAAAIAVMTRSTVWTLAILLPILFLSGQGLGNLDPIRPVVQYFPDQVGMVVMHMTIPGDPQFGRDYGAWTGIAILVAWTAAALAGGWFAMRRRDA